jgi:hypothetical protein
MMGRMIAYKGFCAGLVCRDYQFAMGKNVTDQANCRSNGFHCAEDPLDCLTYYPDMDKSEYYLVYPGGDIDEDEVDSKIACTELTIAKKLERTEFFLHALAYMVDHPAREWSSHVEKDRAEARNGYAVVRGPDPIARGKKGDVLALAKEDPDSGKIVQIALSQVDGKKLKPGKWYGIDLQIRKAG